jgi:uncharacterized protein (TIGR02588 family)
MRQNWLEWGALAISVMVVVGVVGFLLLDGLRDEGDPPEPVAQLHLDEAYETDHGWILPVTLTNDGDVAAESLVMRATATVAGDEEESETAVAYLPAGTDVDVSFGFSAEAEGEVTVQVISFTLP